jgi:hypothetical protein
VKQPNGASLHFPAEAASLEQFPATALLSVSAAILYAHDESASKRAVGVVFVKAVLEAAHHALSLPRKQQPMLRGE